MGPPGPWRWRGHQLRTRARRAPRPPPGAPPGRFYSSWLTSVRRWYVVAMAPLGVSEPSGGCVARDGSSHSRRQPERTIRQRNGSDRHRESRCRRGAGSSRRGGYVRPSSGGCPRSRPRLWKATHGARLRLGSVRSAGIGCHSRVAGGVSCTSATTRDGRTVRRTRSGAPPRRSSAVADRPRTPRGCSAQLPRRPQPVTGLR
jgi:hypothetical protein